MNRAVGIFIQARALLQDKRKWTQGAYARLANGNLTDPKNTRAACWCVSGAIMKFNDDYVDFPIIREAIRVLYPDSRPSLVEVNDMLGYDAVMSVLDTTITLCGEK